MLRTRATLCLLLLAGCSEAAPPVDSTDPDAGPPIDASGPSDGGLSDAGRDDADRDGGPSDAGPSTPDAGPIAVRRESCAADPAARTITCVIDRDPEPDWVDDETWTQIVVTLAPGAFDGATRSVAGEASYVISERSFAGETIDDTRIDAFVPDAGHDALVEDVRLWHRLHGLSSPTRYERVDITGVLEVDAAGVGHVDLTWGEPTTSPGPGRADGIDTAI